MSELPQQKEFVTFDGVIEEFIKEYYKRMIDERTDISYERVSQEMKFAIDKLVAIYELKYPRDIVLELIDGVTPKESTDVISTAQREMGLCLPIQPRIVDWYSVIDLNLLLPSLTDIQRKFLKHPRSYVRLIDNAGYHLFSLKLDNNGLIENIQVTYTREGKWEPITLDDLQGKSLREALDRIYEKYEIKRLDDYERVADYTEDWLPLRKKFFDCVMYRMIELGGSRIGGRRAFLFALDFNLDISIPIKYGFDSSDASNRCLLIEYLNAGGTPELECYLNYFSSDRTDAMTVGNLLSLDDISNHILGDNTKHTGPVRELKRKVTKHTDEKPEE